MRTKVFISLLLAAFVTGLFFVAYLWLMLQVKMVPDLWNLP